MCFPQDQRFAGSNPTEDLKVFSTSSLRGTLSCGYRLRISASENFHFIDVLVYLSSCQDSYWDDGLVIQRFACNEK